MAAESYFLLVLLLISVIIHYLQHRYKEELLEVIQYFIQRNSWKNDDSRNNDGSA